MSIFDKVTDIDHYIFQFLNEHDLARLSQVNRYYNLIISPLLNNLADFFKYNKNHSSEDLFMKAVKIGNLSICKYLYGAFFVSSIMLKHAYVKSAREGHLNVLKWLHLLIIKRHDFEDTQVSSFQASCENGYEDIAIWIASQSSSKNFVYFTLSCEYNLLKTAKYLYAQGFVNMQNDNKDICDTCCLGNIGVEFMEWFVSLGLDIHNSRAILFHDCCRNNNLDVAKWLYRHTNIDVYSHEYLDFRLACEYGYLNVAKWMFSINNQIPEYVLQQLLIKVCHRKFVFEWLCYIMKLKNYKYHDADFYKQHYVNSEDETYDESNTEPNNESENELGNESNTELENESGTE